MKRILFMLLVSVSLCQLRAQQTAVIYGRLLNLAEQDLEIVPNTGSFRDSIPIKADGTFRYEFKQIKTPMRIALTNRKQVQIQVFMAPGYNLEISANVKDYQTAKKTLTYNGLGAKSNAYWAVVNANFKPDTVKWHLKNPDEYVNHQLKLSANDSLINAFFDASNHEPYAEYFKKSLLIDKKYAPILGLYINYGYQKKLSWEQIEALLPKLGFTKLIDNLNNPDNLCSATFSYLVNEYPFYCELYSAFPRDSILKKNANYRLYLTSQLFRGAIYDDVVRNNITSSLRFTYKQSELDNLQPYINKISDKQLKKELIRLKDQQLLMVSKFAKGEPSPLFNLPDTSGNFHRLSQFKGKVVYIDLWASWCGPCKEETPYLKKIVEKYKDNPNIAVISIAAFDAKNRTRRYDMIKKEQMDWLQLEDTTDSFAKSYRANSIPRFIIIDKNGNIVDNDALRPSQAQQLTAILDREIRK